MHDDHGIGSLGQSGFLVAAIDSNTLQEIDSQTFAVNTGDATTEAANQQAMANYLGSYADNAGALVLVQSIGAVAPTSSSYAQWGQIAAQIDALGGEQQTFNTIADTGTPGGYSLLGGAGVEGSPPVAESSSNLYYYQGQGVATRVMGLLEVGHSNRYVPTMGGPVADPSAAANLGLPQLAYPPSTPWPGSSDPAEVAAEHWISSELCNPGCDSDIRNEYVYDSYDFNSDVRRSHLPCEASSYGGTSFTLGDCEAVLTQLGAEYSLISQVRDHWFQQLLNLLTQANLNSASSLDTVSTTIDNIVYPPATSETHVSASDIGEGFLDILWSLDIPGLSTIAGLADGALQIGTSISTTQSGDPLADIDTTAANLGSEASTNYNDILGAVGNLEDIILTDWGKLNTLAGLIQHHGPQWGLPSTSTQFNETFGYAARQFFYAGMLPTVYHDVTIPYAYWHWDIYSGENCVATPTNNCRGSDLTFTADPWDYNCPEPKTTPFYLNLQPFKDLSSQGSPTAYYQRIGQIGSPTDFEWHVMAEWSPDQSSPPEYTPYAPQSLTEKLFGDPSSGSANAGFPIQYAFDLLSGTTYTCAPAGSI